MLLIICRRAGVLVRNTLRPSVLGLTECHSWLSPFLSNLVAVTNGTRIRINVLRINDLRSTLTSIRFIELYINNREYDSETQGLPSSEIEIMLLIICRRAGVLVRNTLRPSVLGLTECHSCQSHDRPSAHPRRRHHRDSTQKQKQHHDRQDGHQPPSTDEPTRDPLHRCLPLVVPLTRLQRRPVPRLQPQTVLQPPRLRAVGEAGDFLGGNHVSLIRPSHCLRTIPLACTAALFVSLPENSPEPPRNPGHRPRLLDRAALACRSLLAALHPRTRRRRKTRGQAANSAGQR